jgi:hypothetical protein
MKRNEKRFSNRNKKTLSGAGAAVRLTLPRRPKQHVISPLVQMMWLVFWRGLFLGFGCCFGFRGPRRDDAVHARVGDGLS